MLQTACKAADNMSTLLSASARKAATNYLNLPASFMHCKIEYHIHIE